MPPHMQPQPLLPRRRLRLLRLLWRLLLQRRLLRLLCSLLLPRWLLRLLWRLLRRRRAGHARDEGDVMRTPKRRPNSKIV